MSRSPHTVLLVDDHAILRTGLRTLLDRHDDVHVVGEASTGAGALSLAHRHKPDVVVLDMELPDLDGPDVASRLQSVSDGTRILALSAHEDPDFVSELWALGAAGYVTKQQPPALIVDAVRAVARGEGRWLVTPHRTPAPPSSVQLTDRETDVLALVAQGHSNAAVADKLCIAENTVKNHMRNLYAKLDLSSQRELVAWAWKNGLAHP